MRSSKQLAVDVTLRSVLAADGSPRPRSSTVDGVVAASARKDKEDKYPELTREGRCCLIVVSIETGGRWDEEAAGFLQELSWCRAQSAPVHLRAAAALAWERRWARMLAVACSSSFARSLVMPPSSLALVVADGNTPELCDLL